MQSERLLSQSSKQFGPKLYHNKLQVSDQDYPIVYGGRYNLTIKESMFRKENFNKSNCPYCGDEYYELQQKEHLSSCRGEPLSEICQKCKQKIYTFEMKDHLVSCDPENPILKSVAECAICLQFMRSFQGLIGLGCGHVYHIKCLNEILHSQKKCPQCSTPINLES